MTEYEKELQRESRKMEFTRVIDNLGGNNLGKYLRRNILPASNCSFASAFVTVSGFEIVSSELEGTEGFRLLLGAEPESNPLEIIRLDILKNIDTRGSIRQSERVIRFLERDDVLVRMHPKPFFHGKAYILNHPKPDFKREPQGLTHPSSAYQIQSPEIVAGPNRLRQTDYRFIGQAPDCEKGCRAIVGSSNFTYGGLSHNTELDLLDVEGKSVVELLTWFEERWDASEDFKGRLIELLKGYCTPLEPFWIYAKALYDLYRDDFGPEMKEGKGSTIELADFQNAGYKSAKRFLDRWNGVLIADAPGLGKTFIAGKILEDFGYFKREKPLVICPAEVEQIWRDFAKEYDVPLRKGDVLHTEVLGRGMRNSHPDINPIDYKNHSIIIVDECHHFRNPESGRYAWLQELLSLPRPETKEEGQMKTVERKVVFVSATPVNNSVWDLYWQYLILFREKAEEIADSQGITNLHQYFEDAESGEGNLYDLLEKCAVRRSRSFIKEHYPNATLKGKLINFPERKLGAINYSLDTKLGDLYTHAAAAIERLRLAPYRIEEYRVKGRDEEKVRRGELLSGLFQVLLLKRLESSLWAFSVSTRRLIALFEGMLKMTRAGRVFSVETYREYADLLEDSEEDGVSADAPPLDEVTSIMDFDAERLESDIAADIGCLRKLLAVLPEGRGAIAELDSKAKITVDTLLRRKGKVLVFTSFMDTADYLFDLLQKPNKPVGLVTGDKSYVWTGSQKVTAKRLDIIKKFSPISNEARIQAGQELDIVVSTDVFSEAINLQDADAVLNYDLPWNPMKLVQRAGRIDRIGSRHREVTVFNVFPEKGLDSLLNLMERLQTKIEQAHRSVGLEISLLGETPLTVDFATTLERVRKNDSEVLSEIEKKMEGIVGLDPQEQLLAMMRTVSKEELEQIPDGVGSVTRLDLSRPSQQTGFFVSYRRRTKGKELDRIWRFYPDSKPRTPILSKTQIVDQIRYPRGFAPESRIDDESLNELKEIRNRIEKELHEHEIMKRTPHVTGPLRKALQLSQRIGRADLFAFLEQASRKPAVQRNLKKINFKEEQKAIDTLIALSSKFGTEAIEEIPLEEPPAEEAPRAVDVSLGEIPPLPEGMNPNLELVCWMHVIESQGRNAN